ncbi:metallophosphoesterase [Agromyces sp. G08B096]|uniref:Metallophosphoesterase n=1 Tax=Agromyces sp. G08B096 TaxID=3156399 RepID=A0AAU7W5Z3_9MICO
MTRRPVSLASTATPVTSTVQRTLVPGEVLAAGVEAPFRRLAEGPGEPHLPRGGRPDAAEPLARVRLGHLTDLHLADVASPLRLDFVDPARWSGPVPYAFRPQELLATRAVTAALETLDALGVDLVVQTGDAVDNAQRNEVRSYLAAMRGGRVDPLLGDPDASPLSSEWPVQRVWQPERPGNAYSERFGLPVIPGLLAEAAATHASGGLETPWVAVRGNHDVLVLGTARLGDDFDGIARGARKPLAGDPHAHAGLDEYLTGPHAVYAGPAATIAADEARALLGPREFAVAHRDDRAGPVAGHGLASSPDAERHGRYVADLGDRFRLVAFDTNNHRGMWDGMLAREQLAWVDDALSAADEDGRLAVLVTHHGSGFLANDYRMCADEIADPDAIVDLLLRRRNTVAWLNGHHHGNQVRIHPRPGGSGVVEITTAAIADWPCQVREIEIEELPRSIRITTTMHHAAVGERPGLDTPAELARLHHELAANELWRGAGRPGALGADADRNVVVTLVHPLARER